MDLITVKEYKHENEVHTVKPGHSIQNTCMVLPDK